MGVDFTQIGSTSDWWFWALRASGGKLYAGTYEMELPRIYKYPSWAEIESFSGGESVLGIREFEGSVYCASEDMGNEGHIYKRITDTNWTSVHHEGSWFVKPFEVHGGYLYSAWGNGSGGVKILRSSNGTDWIQVKTWTDKHLVRFAKYNGQLYILGGKYAAWDSWAARTPNWDDVAVLCNHPNYPWHSGVEFGGKLILGQDGGQSLYRYDGSSKTKVLQAAAGVFGTHSCHAFDSQVYFLFGQDWKAGSGESRIYRSPSGNLNDWGNGDLYGSPLKVFSGKPNARCVGIHNSKLYVGIQNIVYRMDEEEPEEAPDPPSNCTGHFVSPDKSYCTWSDNSDNETGFRVEYSINDGAWTFFENKGTNATQSSQRQFAVGKSVEWRVRAYNAIGSSTWSTSASVYLPGDSGIRLMWGVENVGDLELVKAAGCNVVFCTNFDSKSEADQIAYVNECKSLGLKLTWNLWGGDWEHRTETILRWKDDSVVFAWYYITEPYNPAGGCYLTTAEQEVRYNDFVNIIGETNIPYMQDRGLFNTHFDYWYEDGLDILMVYSYAYEFPDNLDWIYNRMFANLTSLKTRPYPVIPLIQCFWAGDYTQPPIGAVQDQYTRWKTFLEGMG